MFLLILTVAALGSAGLTAEAQERERSAIVLPQDWPHLESIWLKNWQRPDPLPPADTLTLFLMGDFMMHQSQISADWSTFLEPLKPGIQKADIAVANMEFTLAGKPYSGYPCFSAPDGIADYAIESGIDVFLAANNHILDRGSRGLRRTISVYDSLERAGLIRYTGIALDEEQDTLRNPLILESNGIRIALINCTYGTNAAQPATWPKVRNIDIQQIADDIQRARRNGAEMIIVLPHWGIEYDLRHSKRQAALARQIAEAGADLIVGSHPHVVQDCETLTVADAHGNSRYVPVWYSLGNVISAMSAENTRIGLALNIKIVRNVGSRVKIHSIEPVFTWCTHPGRICDSFSTVVVTEYSDHPELWKMASDYHNMVNTFKRVGEHFAGR